MADALYTFLYTWINQILNTEESLSIPIIESNQDAPAPSVSGTYIVIEYAPNRTKVGRAYHGDTENDGSLKLTNDYSYLVQIWEVNGSGELLELLINSVSRSDIKRLWQTNEYSMMSQGSVQSLPRLQENSWRRESLVELTIGGGKQTTEQSDYIEDVEYTGTVPAQGRTGNHIVTNT